MRCFLFLVTWAFAILARAQLTNNTFRITPQPPRTTYGFTFEALQFLKNNEYFNPINPGETLFGFQGKVLFHYKLAPNATISAGTLLQKDYGDPRFFSQAYPLLNFEIRQKAWNFQLGSVKPHIHHNLTDPMLNYENVLKQPVEYGFQARRESSSGFYDIWLNWRQKANGEEKLQEQIIFGQSLDYTLARIGSLSLNNPVQTIVYHQGGQALNIDAHIRTTVNAATGLRLVYKDSSTLGFGLQSMALASADNSPTLSQPYQNGWASLTTLFFTVGYHEISLNWWYGREFTSATGNPVFSNVNLNNVYANRGTRRLAMLRYVYSRPIAKKLWLDFRLEPYYDIENSAMEFSQGLYIRYVGSLNVKFPKWLGF